MITSAILLKYNSNNTSLVNNIHIHFFIWLVFSLGKYTFCAAIYNNDNNTDYNKIIIIIIIIIIMIIIIIRITVIIMIIDIKQRQHSQALSTLQNTY